MLVRLFLALLSLSSAVRSAVWKWWYERLAAFYPHKDWRFMNYGFAPLTEEAPLPLKESDEEYRLFIQLYAHVLSELDLQGKNVLEVGCGRGGGADWVARTIQPAQLTAVDYSPKAIALAQRFFPTSNLTFIEGNAEKLPFASATFDIVYNVESSHCYGDMRAFVSEVERVLKPGGYFCWADLRETHEKDALDKVFEESPLKILFKEEITPHVLKALEQISADKEKQIKSKVPYWLQRPFMEFAGVKSSKIYNSFQSEKMGYWHYRLRKP